MIQNELQQLVSEIIEKLYTQEVLDKVNLVIEEPKDASHGDFACTVAMHLAKLLEKNPREIAEEIIKEFKKPDYIENISIEGPGFINFQLSSEYLIDEIQNITKSETYTPKLDIGKGDTAIVEYSQPNIAKPLGVHHLLSTIIGQALYNILDSVNFKTISINHIGDWGTQFGKLIYAYRTWGDEKVVKKDPIPELLKLYVKFHDEAEKDKVLEDHGRAEFKKLEDGDEENKKLWSWIVDLSMQDVQKTYDKLGGIHFDYTTGESFYEDKMQVVIDEGIDKKVITEGEKGALVTEFPDDKLQTALVRKSDGATLYSTRDLATIRYRVDTYHPTKILYVVDVAQQLHFQQVFEIVRMMGWDLPETTHVIFGRMRFPDLKMSTRKGNILLLDEVIEEAIERALKIVTEKSPDIPEEERKDIARKVGVGAMKYITLSQGRTTNVTFTWDKMLALDGNSAPYLQYTYARGQSILRKAKEEGINLDGLEISNLTSDKEVNLARAIVRHPLSVIQAAQEYKPNLLSNSIYSIARLFNEFYNSEHVLSEKDESVKNSRLVLVDATCKVLKQSLGLLGIECPERM